jgi:hypothetical protein
MQYVNNAGIRRPQRHLINLLADTRNQHPTFTLFLGAGASATSGVKTASQMIKEWRHRHIDIYGPENADAAAHKGKPTEYSYLFETLYDHPSQRRDYIEACINNAQPAWGWPGWISCTR